MALDTTAGRITSPSSWGSCAWGHDADSVSLWWSTLVRLSYPRWEPIRSRDTRISVCGKTSWSVLLIPRQRYSTSIYMYSYNDDFHNNIYQNSWQLLTIEEYHIPQKRASDRIWEQVVIAPPITNSTFSDNQHLGSMPLITKAKVARWDHGLSQWGCKGCVVFCLVLADCVNSCLALMQIAHLIIPYTTPAEALSADSGWRGPWVIHRRSLKGKKSQQHFCKKSEWAK